MTFGFFGIAIGALALAFLVDLLYVMSSKYKRWLKVWRMMGELFFIFIYYLAAQGEALFFVRSGRATVMGIVFFSMCFIFDTIADMARR